MSETDNYIPHEPSYTVDEFCVARAHQPRDTLRAVGNRAGAPDSIPTDDAGVSPMQPGLEWQCEMEARVENRGGVECSLRTKKPPPLLEAVARADTKLAPTKLHHESKNATTKVKRRSSRETSSFGAGLAFT